eukprot:403359681
MGFGVQDLQIKPYQEFQSEFDDQEDEEIILLRYDRYKKKIKQRLDAVDQERSRIKKQQQKKELRQSKILVKNDSSFLTDLPQIQPSSKSPNKLDIYINASQMHQTSVNRYRNQTVHKPESLEQGREIRSQKLAQFDSVNKTQHMINPYQSIQVNNNGRNEKYGLLSSHQTQGHHEYNSLTQNQSKDQLSPTSSNQLNSKKSEKKIFSLIDLKIEKAKQDELRRKQIMEKLNKKFESSEIQRNQILIEDVQAKAKKNIYAKLDALKQKNITIEQKQSSEFLLDLQRLKDRKMQAHYFEKEQRKQEKERYDEEIRQREQKQYELQLKNNMEFESNQMLLESINHRHQRSQQKMFENIKQKSDYLKYKNQLLSEKKIIAQEFQQEKERQIAEMYLKNAQNREQIYQSRQQRFQSQNNVNNSMYTMQQNQDSSFNQGSKNKYSVLNKSMKRDSSDQNFDLSLFQSLEERLKKATERKEEQEKQREKQVIYKKELEKLRLEEIAELKRIQEKQRNVIKRQIIDKQREKEQQVRMIRDSMEKRAKDAYHSQIKLNKEKEYKIRQSLNLI